MTGLLEVDAIEKSYGGVRALRGVGFGMSPGAILGLVGPNGSGKTTLLNVINGFERPTRGTIRLEGADVTRWLPDRRARSGVARVFQAPHLVPEWSVEDNVEAGTYMHARWRKRGRSSLVHAALDQLGVGDLAARPAGSLPFGTRRLVEISRALVQEPKLLLLDEPATGMTGIERSELAKRLRLLAADGLAVILVEHDTGFVFDVCEEVLVLDAGEMLAHGAPDEVAADERVTRAYLGTTRA